MIDELKLLKNSDYEINDGVKIRLPTLGEICDFGERDYYRIVSVICATPSDYKSILFDDFNIDYEEVEDFEFFIMMAGSLKNDDISIILPDISFADFQPAYNETTGLLSLLDAKHNRVIDEVTYLTIVNYLRSIHGFEKHVDKAGNEVTKKYLINKARKELKRNKGAETGSILAPLVSSMVNCEQFKYDHTTVWDLNIYQFMDSVRRVQKLKNYSQIMQGVYAGTIDSSKINTDSVNWLGALK